MHRLLIIGFFLCWNRDLAFGQLRWKKVDSLFGTLPKSVHIFQTSDSLDGAPFLAFFASIRLKDPSLSATILQNQEDPATLSQYYSKQGNQALLLVNGPFFDQENGRILSLLMKNGRIISHPVHALRGTDEDSLLYYYPTRFAMGIDRRKRVTMNWIFTEDEVKRPYAFINNPLISKGFEKTPSIYDLGSVNWIWWEVRTAIGGGPCLVHQGKIRITNKEEQVMPDAASKSPRTAMGVSTDNNLYILVIEGRSPGISMGANLEQEAKIMKSLGCYQALNLDGGGSTEMLVNGKPTIHPSDPNGSRKLPAAFAIKWNPAKEK